MRSFFTGKPGKYLSRIYLWVAAATVVIVTIFSAIIYYNVDKMVMQNENNMNKKILSQVRYNIEYMDEIIKNLCLTTYLNSDTISMMFGDHFEYDELAMKINKLRTSVVGMNTYVDSVCIYNNKEHAYITTDKGLLYEEQALDDIFSTYGTNLPKMKPILRNTPYFVPGSTISRNKFLMTYYLYDSFSTNNMPDGALIINIKSEWLIDSISAIHAIAEDKVTDNVKEVVFVFDQNGQCIEGDNGLPITKNNDKDSLKDAIQNSLIKNNEEKSSSANDNTVFNTLTMDNRGEKYFVSSINIDKLGWTLVIAQSFNQTYKYINRLRTSIMFITLLFILLALILAITVSKGIYKPVGNLVQQITGSKGLSNVYTGSSKSKDEITYLSNVYKNSMEMLNKIQREKGNNRNILRTYLLRQILVDSPSAIETDLEKVASDYGLTINFFKKFAVCVIRIDKSYALEQLDASEMDLYQFAIINISSEVFAKYYASEGIDVREDHVVILINVLDKTEEYYKKMTEVMREAQNHIFKYFQLSVSMTISEIGNGISDVTKLYHAALDSAVYSYVGGESSVILPTDFTFNKLNTQMSFSATLERKLSEGIKSGNFEQIEYILKQILDEISKLKYKNMMLSVMHLVNVLSDTVDEINTARIEPVFIDFNAFQKILDMCTIQELYDSSMNIIEQMISSTDSNENRKHLFLVDAMKEIIHANYQKPDLCLQQIADSVKMSPVYIGKIFKGITKLSVAEYMNMIRLKHASDLLCQGNLSINEIVSSIGMENESYFYRLFKSKYGVTPREYCLNHSVKNQ